MHDLIPPINKRTTNELLRIVGFPEDWQSSVLIQAREELRFRNISEARINQAKYLAKKQIKLESLKKAKESYTVLDFIGSPLATLFEILISWELRKDGFERKANQQRWLRPIFIFLIIAVIVILNLL